MMSIRILIIHNSFADHDMFMRYRGGGVGHLYMRAIEVWLAETGWGSDDWALLSTDEDTDSTEEDSEDGGENGSDRGSEEEVPEDDMASNGTTSSDGEQSAGVDSDVELSSENDEETLDGEYGFSAL